MPSTIGTIVRMTIPTLKDYSNLMCRQLLILFLSVFFFFPQQIYSATPTHQTLEIPSDEGPQKEKYTPPTNINILQDQGLEESQNPTHYQPPTFHLKPSPSFSLTGSSVYNVQDNKLNTWLGLHVAPWMKATYRIQIGVDIYNRWAWPQVAYHQLISRNRTRFYWGGGISVVADSKEDLRSFLELENYYAFATGGWEWQVQPLYNIRLEASYHQSTDLSFIRGTLGLTRSF